MVIEQRGFVMTAAIVQTPASARIDAAKFMLWVIATTAISAGAALFSILAWAVPH